MEVHNTGSLGSNPDAAIATLVVPSFRSITVILTITDDAGSQTTGSVVIESLIAAGTGKKGGALGPGWLALLAAFSLRRVYRRRQALLACAN